VRLFPDCVPVGRRILRERPVAVMVPCTSVSNLARWIIGIQEREIVEL